MATCLSGLPSFHSGELQLDADIDLCRSKWKHEREAKPFPATASGALSAYDKDLYLVAESFSYQSALLLQREAFQV